MIGYRIFFICIFFSSFVCSEVGYLTTINKTVGTLNGGTLLSTFWIDSYYYNITEVVATPGIIVNGYKNDLLTNQDFNISVKAIYSEPDIEVYVQAYNVVSGVWDSLGTINNTHTVVNSTLDKDLYLSGNETKMRFNHPALGVGGDILEIDMVSYYFVSSTPTTTTTTTTLEVLSTSNASTIIYYTSYGEENYAIETCTNLLGCEIYTFNDSFLVGGYPSIKVSYWGIYDYVTNIIPVPFNSSDLSFWYKELNNKWLRWISAILIFIFAFLSLRQIYATFINRF